MRRGLTILELVTAMTAVLVLVTALAVGVRDATRRSRVTKARTEMFGLVAEVTNAENPESAAARWKERAPRDPWGNPYLIEVKRETVRSEASVAAGTMAVRMPNAYRLGGGE